jgi:hypothetical protein
VKQRSVVMTAVILVALVICSAPVLLALGASSKDSSNRFPETGAFIVWAGQNSEGFREGLFALCTGALIHERVFLTRQRILGNMEPAQPGVCRRLGRANVRR